VLIEILAKTLIILNEVLRGFPQLLQANDGLEFSLGNEGFIANSFQFTSN
jgi:hypothetical protein